MLGRWARIVGAFLVVALAVFIFGWVPYWMGGLATIRRFRYQDDENAGLTPTSFKLPFEDVTFQTADGVSLKGWWVPRAEAKGTVVLVHGLNRSRIEMVKKLPFVNESGWNALLFDLRHHGDSGGDLSSFGFFEKRDVQAAVAEARKRSGGAVVLWGVSLGGATVMLDAAEDPTIAAVICDSSYRSLRDTVTHHLGLFKGFRWWLKVVPTWPVADEVVYWIGKRGGFDPDQVDVQKAATRLVGRPCLFVCNSGDRRMPKEIAFDLQAAVGPSASLLVVPGNSHGGAYRDGTAAYQTAVTQILVKAAEQPAAGGSFHATVAQTGN